ncbi:DUF1996 domain-containing protein [Streptomyces sp. AM8-1-1]|uniref:DUF1996 domain-containing protein n=1 Tax=Streptomyces sp. AM8-1-1 TaxID=3075825 RepID=UPI0028C46B21|nr:DUF1996 domain-containing protein [Streptomyces sp. AM8-1-1]WNO71311.1 DUF1996 domain-containing protein [Streptomyces sp. AM8-1-1]
MTRRRPKGAQRATVAAVALILGGGGLIGFGSFASAGEGSSSGQDGTLSAGASTIECPEVANALPGVPVEARTEVDRELALMDSQITEAYAKFAERKEQIQRDPQLAENAILNPLKDKRQASIDRIATAIGRGGEKPQGMDELAPCELRDDGNDQGDGQNQGDNQEGNDQGQGQDGGQDQGGDNQGQANGGQDGGQDNGGQVGNGPEASDFADIQSIQPNVKAPQAGNDASTGTFATDCGVNENGKFNPDNVIVAPGVANGAHHMHDYVGNQANDAFASDDDLANGDTTCQNQGDKSTYYWPVLRLQNGQDENDANADGGGKDQNTGEIQRPSEVTLNFVGSPVGKVTAMPRFLRIITGDAKALTNGDKNANASWSCTGFEDRQLRDKYPICPEGSKVVRSFKFQSCWDGQNIDSANHRTHVSFANENGECSDGFRAIPQLVQRIVYDVPPGPGFALDSFPEQLHKPITDHGDFINVFDEKLMNDLVDCINNGQKCGPGEVAPKPDETQAPKPDESQAPEPDESQAPQPDETKAPEPSNSAEAPPAPEETDKPDEGGAAPKPDDTTGPDETPAAPGKPAEENEEQNPATSPPRGNDAPGAAEPEAGVPAEPKQQVLKAATQEVTPPRAYNTPAQVANAAAPQGGLADTGARMWPLAAGALLLVAGVVLLRVRGRGGSARHL